MNTSRVRIIPAITGQADTLGVLIATAFHDLAVSRWLVTDPGERLRAQSRQFAMLVRHALAHGDVHTTPEETAVAVWLPDADEHMVPPIQDYARRLAQICGHDLPRFQSLDQAMDDHHPDEPHWYLAFLAVHPDLQGAGVGSALLRHQHQRLDLLGAPAFLHAADRRARDLYLRHGYRAAGEPFPVGDGGPPMYPMWRDPGTRLDVVADVQ